MSSFIFPTIITGEIPNFTTSTFIWIWHADKIPPHIGVSSQNKYFSLKVSGKDDGIDCNSVWDLANKKKIPMVLVELNRKVDLSLIKEEFGRYDVALPNKNTCLTPIGSIFDVECRQLSELLNKLNKKKALISCFGINLPLNYSQLANYTPDDINARLKLLSDA